MKIYVLLILLLAQLGIVSCSDDEDNSSPDLDLIVAEVQTTINLNIDEETLLHLDFENAKGPLSYVWTVDDSVNSEEENFIFSSHESGQYFVNVYVEDAEGKYTSVQFQLIVDGKPLFNGDKVVVGYYPSYRNNEVQWDKITHFIYAHIYPKNDGTLDLSDMAKLSDYVEEAKANNVKILVSLGGAGEYPGRNERVFTNVILNKNKRTKLIKNIVSFVSNNKLDGIDIYYNEFIGGGEAVDNSESNQLLPFYRELRNALPSANIITTSVTGSYGWAAYHYRDIADRMSNIFNLISVMAFDNLGTYENSPLGHPATVKDMENALNRYLEFGVPKNKIVVGIPFYGRDFLNKAGGLAETITYADIIKRYSPSEVELDIGNIKRDGHNIFFDSRNIISQKVNYLRKNDFKGITLWELGQDSPDSNWSLLQDIPSQFEK
ncbi:glycoside hydrolase family 18 protein [Fulvivirga sediminis]|uniref:chitinase n=1 Tax=Fulvivirga sediminis TaxID=2803949 RepID=A0A937F9Y1_9BACT|nr:glycoside hydrolase family 18 protein [Fulvivirga sediminis]MBL3658400.1 glycoside hydrolase family 18 protein [Fulvivirga sediminis]